MGGTCAALVVALAMAACATRQSAIIDPWPTRLAEADALREARAGLERQLAADDRWVETTFFLGRYTLAETARDRFTPALPLFTRAYAALPESPLVTVTLAGVHQVRNELARALDLYDAALALRSTQRDALLGRAITLTYLGRPADAVATATRMLELGTWYLGDAYYWRA